MEHTFTFKKTGKTAEQETQRLAIFVSQLIREGVTFKKQEDDFSVDIILTGGF